MSLNSRNIQFVVVFYAFYFVFVFFFYLNSNTTYKYVCMYGCTCMFTENIRFHIALPASYYLALLQISSSAATTTLTILDITKE